MTDIVDVPVHVKNKGGRPPGSPNLRTRLVQAFCRRICEDEEYRTDLLVRARTRQLGSMEPVIWAYAFGKPKEHLSLSVQLEQEEDLSTLSLEELEQRLTDIQQQLQEAAALEAAIEADYTVDAKSPADPSVHSTEDANTPAESERSQNERINRVEGADRDRPSRLDISETAASDIPSAPTTGH